MRWSGETPEMATERMRSWSSRFAWVPVQLADGTWFWWERYHRREICFFSGRVWVERRLSPPEHHELGPRPPK